MGLRIPIRAVHSISSKDTSVLFRRVQHSGVLASAVWIQLKKNKGGRVTNCLAHLGLRGLGNVGLLRKLGEVGHHKRKTESEVIQILKLIAVKE
jgi:hypothetical protein